jgi:hypothetical protein
MRKIYLWTLILGSFCVLKIDGQVNVTATLGTLTGSYLNLNSAFAAINAGTHRGVINIKIKGNTTETLITPLVSNATGAASYNSIKIMPDSGSYTVTCAVGINRGMLEFLGSDNVTIDGDDPVTAGTKNLTFINASSTSSSCIRFIAASATDGATYNTVKNCIFFGSRISLTAATLSYNIILMGNTTANMTAGGAGNNNNTFQNNEFKRALRGIGIIGLSISSPSVNNTIKNNIFGSSITPLENLAECGIYLAATSSATVPGPTIIQDNDIQAGDNNGSGLSFNVAGIKIDTVNEGTIIRRNNIHDISNMSATGTVGAYGVHIYSSSTVAMVNSSQNNILFENNMMCNINTRRNTFNIFSKAVPIGLFVDTLVNALNISFVHNTVALTTQSLLGTATNDASYGVKMIAPGASFAKFTNNIVSNIKSSVNAYSVYITYYNNIGTPANWRNNGYWCPSGNIGTNSKSLNLWQYLIAGEVNSIVDKPNFVSTSDAHLAVGQISKFESAAFPTILLDIDNENRPGPSGSIYGGATAPDIGADEVDDIPYIAPRIFSYTHTPINPSCAAVSRAVTASVTLGNYVDSVMLSYKFDNGSFADLKMSIVNATTYTAIIPVATPNNALVAYRIKLVLKSGDTVISNLNYYNDMVVTGAYAPAVTATPTQVCANSPSILTYKIANDPTLFAAPPGINGSPNQLNITNFTFKKINNTSIVDSLLGTLGNASGVSGKYANYASLFTDSVTIGRVYPFSVSSNSKSVTLNNFSIFIDFNGNGVFTDAGEQVFSSLNAKTSNDTIKGFIPIIKSAKPGLTRMRVVLNDNTTFSSTAAAFNGETEDYAIYIRPMTYLWKAGTTVIGSANPLTYAPVSTPVNIYLGVRDSFSCDSSQGPTTLTASSGPLTASIASAATSCYNTSITAVASYTGGCSPYTYLWNTGATSSSINLSSIKDTTISVTITDKNGVTSSASKLITISNPLVNTLVKSPTICEQGFDTVKVSATSPKQVFWYNSATDPTNAYVARGGSYITPIIYNTTTYYARARTQTKDSVGRNVLSTAANTNYTYNTLAFPRGINFTANSSLIIDSCKVYGVFSGTFTIAVLDLSGNPIAQTNVASSSTSAAVPTNLTLGLPVPAGTGYTLAITNFVGTYTSLAFTVNGALSIPTPNTFPYNSPASGAMTLLSSNNQGATTTDYLYFYKIAITANECFGQPMPVPANVIQKRVPAIVQNLQPVTLCKGSPLLLSFQTNKFGNKYKWYVHDTLIGNPLTDTFFKLASTANQDSGSYYVVISSDSFCSRDTVTDLVKVKYRVTSFIIDTLKPLNLCLGTSGKLKISASNAFNFIWIKDGATLVTNNDSSFSLNNVTFADSGKYKVIVNDYYNCLANISNTVNVRIFNHPVIDSVPKDTVVCLGTTFVLRGKGKYNTGIEWYKDGGPIPYANEDSLLIRRSKLTDSGLYLIKATSYPGCIPAFSAQAHVTVNAPVAINGYFPTAKFCEGQPITLYSNTTNADSVVWYKNLIKTSIIGTTFYKPSASLSDSGNYYYTAVGKKGCSSLTSNVSKVSIAKLASVNNVLSDVTLCEGDNLLRKFNSTSSSIFQWYKDNVMIQGATSDSIKFYNISKLDEGAYKVSVRSDMVCPEVYSAPFNVIVSLKPKVISGLKDTSYCEGSTVSLSVFATNTFGIQWRYNTANISGANATTYTIPSFNDLNDGYYDAIISGAAVCPTITIPSVYIKAKTAKNNVKLTPTNISKAVEQCTTGDGWSYYADPKYPDNFIFAIKKNGSNFKSLVDVIVNSNYFHSELNDRNLYSGTYITRRMWNMVITNGAISNPIDVKFYIGTKDTTEIVDNMLSMIALQQNAITYTKSNINWFHTVNGYALTNSTLNLVRGNSLNFPVNESPKVAYGVEPNGVLYVKFDSLTGQAGGAGFLKYTGATKFVTAINQYGSTQNMSLNAYPSPSNGTFVLDMQSTIVGTYDCQVFDALGRIVYTTTLSHRSHQSSHPFDLSHVSSGNYQISISNDQISSGVRIIITK